MNLPAANKQNVEFLKREVCRIFHNNGHDQFLILFKADINGKKEWKKYITCNFTHRLEISLTPYFLFNYPETVYPVIQKNLFMEFLVFFCGIIVGVFAMSIVMVGKRKNVIVESDI